MRGRKTPFDFNLNQEDDEEQFDDQQPDERENEGYEQKIMESGEDEELIIQKEAMFEKPLTPSDVGKLNRLVIPKQHAEKYFPIGGNCGGDSVEKGLLLSFEDESGKSWRFRYSYWNSSQSYVLTKGWSRFVKEKRLDAGDVVMFERYRNDGERFFIGWRRRNAVAQLPDSVVAQPPAVVPAGGGGWTRVFYSGHPYPPPQYPNGPLLSYQPDCLHAAAGGSSSAAAAGMQNQTTPSGNSKTVRLFGVNLECQSDEPVLAIPAGGSSQGQAHYHHNYSNTAHLSNHNTHTDINFSRDVNQMRFHQG